MAKARIEIVGDSSSYQRAVKEAAAVTDKLGVDMKQLAVSAKATADAQIKASIRKHARLRQEVTDFNAIARSAERGSEVQILAAKGAVDAQRQLQRALGLTAVETRKVAGEAAKLAAVNQAARGGLSALGGRTSLLFGSTAFVATAGVAAGLKAVTVAAADFQSALFRMQGATGATRKEMAAVRLEAIKLGADIRLPATSALDAAQAMTELSKGGLTVAESMKAARGTLQLAAAAQTDETTAAQITARVLSAFALSGDQAGAVADALANSATAATGEIGDVAIALQQSATVAHQFGLSAQDTVTALTELAKAGLIGSDAGTSLRVTLTRLLPGSAAARREMKQLGVTVTDASGNFKPFREIIESYNKALSRLTPAQRANALRIIFGTDAQRAANIIFGQSVKVYDNLAKSVTRHGGAARISAAQMKGFRGAQESFNSALQTNEILLGEKLLPSLTNYLRSSAKWLSDTKNQKKLQEDFQTAITGVSSVLKTLKGVIDGVDKVTGSFKNTLELLLALKAGSVLAGWATKFTKLGTAAGEAGAAGEVSALAGSLGKLKALGIITVGVEILIHRKQIGDKVGDIFSGLTGSKKIGDLANFIERAGIDAANPPAAARDIVNFLQGRNATPKSTGPSDIQKQIAAENAFLRRQRRPQTPTPGTPASVSALAGGGGGTRPIGLAGRFNLADLRLANAQLTKTSADDRAILLTEAAIVRQQVAGAKKLKDKIALTQQLAGILGQIQGIDAASATAEKEAAKAAKDRAKTAREHTLAVLQARQFRVLGLDASGSPLTPGARSLRRELGNISEAVSGTFLDTSKTKSVLAKIRRVLGGGLGALSKDVRSTVKQMLDDLDQQLKDHSGPETRFKAVSTNQILAGLGLNPAQTREARARLSQLGTGGTVPAGSRTAHNTAQIATTVIHTHFMLDGREVAVNTTKHQQKAGRRNPPQKRGAFAGGGR